jgi:hypothetical protein
VPGPARGVHRCGSLTTWPGDATALMPLCPRWRAQRTGARCPASTHPGSMRGSLLRRRCRRSVLRPARALRDAFAAEGAGRRTLSPRWLAQSWSPIATRARVRGATKRSTRGPAHRLDWGRVDVAGLSHLRGRGRRLAWVSGLARRPVVCRTHFDGQREDVLAVEDKLRFFQAAWHTVITDLPQGPFAAAAGRAPHAWRCGRAQNYGAGSARSAQS